MDIFEYLPQLIVAYDGNDEFANLIHVKKAILGNDYYCPCCGGTVRSRALDSNKEQSHYWHQTGKCTKESQLHFFCKNWLFEEGSKFYIDNELFEVASIDIEKAYSTPFGDYKPDITVYTTNEKTIYFEIFFTNRKTGDDYFCKWESLGNDVVEVNIKEYMFKTDSDTIPSFTYLYHDGVCYSKPYVKRDLYANTIARIKHELTRQKVLNYKARIEQLDWFWQEIRNNTRESILNVVSKMEYEDMVSCYGIINKKHCVSYLKDDILEIINKKVISEVRESLDLPHDENVYFDLKHIKGRTYEAGIRLNIKTDHILYDAFYISNEDNCCNSSLKNQLKIVFSKNIYTFKEIELSEKEIKCLKERFEITLRYKKQLLVFEEELRHFEKDNYMVRVKNNFYTVLAKKENNNCEIIFENHYINDFNINKLNDEINQKILEITNHKFLNALFTSDEYNSFLSKMKNYENIDIRIDIRKYTGYYKNGIKFKLYISERCVYSEELAPNFYDFIKNTIECESLVQAFVDSYSTILNLVNNMNSCKNNFWKVRFYFDYNGYPSVEIDQKIFTPKKYLTFVKISFEDFILTDENRIKDSLKYGMLHVLKNMEKCGYRVMEVRD